MYSTMAVSKHSKASGSIIGTHQQIDRIARKVLTTSPSSKVAKFPDLKMILHFEGTNGPDGLKTKSPGIDEPMHFIDPTNDDGVLLGLIRDHQYNLRKALKHGNEVRAAFEAAWLAHAITDGLTPAHHSAPPQIITSAASSDDDSVTEKDFVRIFGVTVKGLVRTGNAKETLKNNWHYWTKGDRMSKHIAFEYGVALGANYIHERTLTPAISKHEFKNRDIEKIFYSALEKIVALDMYNEFITYGWTPHLDREVRLILLPEIIKTVTLAWNSVL